MTAPVDELAAILRQFMHDAKARLPQLDGLRGIAILTVVWWHYFNCQIRFTPDSPMWLKYLWQTTSLTWSGVDLFFVLSGFLITGILLDHSQSPNVLRVFYVRRAARILPLYLLVLAAAGLAYVFIGNKPGFYILFHDPPPAWSFLTFTQNIMMSAQGTFGGGFLGMTWSLAVEEQFYLVWPLVVLLCGNRRKLLGLSVLLCLCAPLFRYLTPGIGGFVNMPHRMDSLLFGSIAALLVRNETFVTIVRDRPRYLGLLFFALLPAVLVLARFGKIFGVLNHAVLALFYTTILLHAVIHGEGKVSRMLSVRWLGWFGVLSYAIYMFHEAFVGLLHGALLGMSPSITHWAGLQVTLFSFILVLVAAVLSMRFFESPFLAWGRRCKFTPAETVAESKATMPATTGAAPA